MRAPPSGGHFFLLATSFLHHIKYMATFHHRTRASFGKFIRDSAFYKVLRGMRYATRRPRATEAPGPAHTLPARAH